MTLLILTLVATVEAFASVPIAPAELPNLVERVMPGVVNISSTTVVKVRVLGMDEFMNFWGIPRERKHTSLGSGFLIDHDGFIITNNHVVEHASEVMVTLFDQRQFKAKIIGKDQKLDLALLQIREDETRKVPENLTPVPMGDSELVRIAEPVFAVGNPFGLQHTVTMGIISARNRTIGQGPFDHFLQTDASINPGNSGGPLFNLKGEVIGINTAIFSQTGQSGGLGFAIPSNEAKKALADLKRYGHVPRPWLGILSERITPALQSYYNLSAKEGVLIYNMVESGPADNAGIRLSDIVLAINGNEVKEPIELEKHLMKQRPGETAELKILRGRKTLNIKVKLKELPELGQLPQGII